MIDDIGRSIDYLRVSVTDRCNLRCRHCMPPEGVTLKNHDELLSFEEIIRIVKIGTGLGIRNVKLTGGEPLLRRGIVNLVEGLAAIPGIEEVTMTTNGVLLDRFAEALALAGLSAVNVSVHAGTPERYKAFTGTDAFDEAIHGIARARACGIATKINCVVADTNGIEDYLNIAGIARRIPIDIRFIELMPVGYGATLPAVPLDSLVEALEERYGPSRPSSLHRGNGPSVYREYTSLMGAVGFIGAMSHSFCGSCNRVRLTSAGALKPCLFDPAAVSLRDAMRGETCEPFSDGEIANLMAETIFRKPAAHDLCRETAYMSGIGG